MQFSNIKRAGFIWVLLATVLATAPIASQSAQHGATDAFAADSETSVPQTPADLKSDAWITEGRAKFVQTCAYCHGQEGDSGKVAPFRERKDWDPQFIHDTIANGRQRGANVMPTWKDSIPDELIWKLVAYIKSLEGKPKSPPVAQ